MNRWSADRRVFLLCGAIFSAVGFFFLLVSVLMPVRGTSLPLLSGFLGLIMLILGIALLVWCSRQNAKKRRLLHNGIYVTAEITGFPINPRLRVNWMPTWQVECCYRDPTTGTLHIFRSESLLVDPATCVSAQTVRVYTDPKQGFRDYYVDVAPLFPEIQIH